MKKLFLVLIINNLLLASSDDKFVITCRPYGFFSNFIGTLTNIRWAENNKKIPVIYWDEYSLYYDPNGYNGSTNVWEYYFEQISNLNYNPGDELYWKYYDPDSFYLPALLDSCYNQFYKDIFSPLIKKYIKIKPNIQNKINTFYTQQMSGKKNIGIHLRGTDKFIEIKPVDPNIIFDRANEIAKELKNNYQFLVATDEEKLLNLAKSKLNGKVVFYNSHRSLNDKPVWEIHTDCKPLLGEEILIESQLLSKCDYLIHTSSNVSIVVCYFNPEIKNILLSANN